MKLSIELVQGGTLVPEIWKEPIAYETPFGAFTASWSEHGLYSFRFATAGDFDSDTADTSAASILPDRDAAVSLRRAVDRYLESGQLNVSEEHLDWSGIAGFSLAVLRQCLRVPTGTTWTYGKLAALAGSRSAGRAVGSIMAKNRWPLIIPCHRIVGINGNLTGYSGVGGLETKQRILEFERGKIYRELF